MAKDTFLHGAHTSIADGFIGAALESVEELKANAMQIFIKSPRSFGVKKISTQEAKEFRDYAKNFGLKFFVAHCSYLLNFAKPLSKNEWAVKLLVNDIECVAALGGNGVVLHIGKYLELDKKKAFSNIAANIHKVLDMTKNTGIPLLLETTAGQGTEIGYRFEELNELYEVINRSDRIRFCIDTCHIFAAGYDIRTTKGVAAVFKEWDKLLGISKIACIHLNDSMKPLGSRVDRHEDLGKGMIGLEGLKAVVKFAKKHHIPVILETPERTQNYAQELEILRSWVK